VSPRGDGPPADPALPQTRRVIVRAPSWGPATYHLSHVSLLPRHRGDAERLGIDPMADARLVEALEEGGAVSLAVAGVGSVSYGLEPLGE